MKINYNELCSIECSLKNIAASHSVWTENCPWNYETSGRPKHLLFYQVEGERVFSCGGKTIHTSKNNDIVFMPNGTKYSSINPIKSVETAISFDLYDCDGNYIDFDEPLEIIHNDKSGQIYQRFKKILVSAYHPNTHSLMIHGELFSLLDMLFSAEKVRIDFRDVHGDIFEAIRALETNPALNLSNAQLAEMCYMSEASFLRKFKKFSGGISPLKYRNHIRLMKAEELINSSYSVDKIAHMLGFYDGAHLCRIYKQIRGHSLKRRV